MFNFLPMFDYLILIRSVPLLNCVQTVSNTLRLYTIENVGVCTDLIKPAYRVYALLYNGEFSPDSPVF